MIKNGLTSILLGSEVIKRCCYVLDFLIMNKILTITNLSSVFYIERDFMCFVDMVHPILCWMHEHEHEVSLVCLAYPCLCCWTCLLHLALIL